MYHILCRWIESPLAHCNQTLSSLSTDFSTFSERACEAAAAASAHGARAGRTTIELRAQDQAARAAHCCRAETFRAYSGVPSFVKPSPQIVCSPCFCTFSSVLLQNSADSAATQRCTQPRAGCYISASALASQPWCRAPTRSRKAEGQNFVSLSV